MLPNRVDRPSPDNIRAILDEFDVGGRLRHIREFVWRGGAIQLHVNHREDGQALDVSYALTAEWPAPVLEQEPSPASHALVGSRQPVLDGRWIRGTRGYELRVGVTLSTPSAIYLRSQRLLALVPFLSRPVAQVEEALNAELTTYVDTFLSQSQPVPHATAIDAQRLRQLGLAA